MSLFSLLTRIRRGSDTPIDEDTPRSKPEVLKKPESLMVQEGDWARFSVRVSGYPKPRVMWIVNGSTAMSVSRVLP